MRPAPDGHEAFVTTYVNPAALASITRRQGMSYGSLIVTENYGSDQKLASITAKLRIKGYHPERGDWYWFKFAPAGNILAQGQAACCLNCHSRQKENDYILTAPVRQSSAPQMKWRGRK